MSDDDPITEPHTGLGPLAFLSLQHPARDDTPAAPSNEDRLRAWRNTLPALPGNDYDWPFRQAARVQGAGG